MIKYKYSLEGSWFWGITLDLWTVGWFLECWDQTMSELWLVHWHPGFFLLQHLDSDTYQISKENPQLLWTDFSKNFLWNIIDMNLKAISGV